MATKETVKFVTNEDLLRRKEETRPYEVKDFGFVEMRGLTHGEMREMRAKHEDENAAIKDFVALCEDLAKLACVTPKLTDLIVEEMVDAERVIRVIGHRAGYQAGYLTNPPEQDMPKVAGSEADPTVPPAAPISTST